MRAKEFQKTKGKPRVYLDMDGVLADFFTEYAKLAGIESGNYRDIPPAKTDPTLQKMVGTNFFARLPKFPTADTLVSMTVKTFGGYSICSSPLRGDHEGSAHYKKEWISKHLRPGPQEIIITPQKQKHAVQPDGTPNILVDDRGANITAWEAAGGIGIKYQADEDSLNVVMKGYSHALDVVNGDVKHEPRQLVSKDRSLPVATQDDDVKEHIYQEMINDHDTPDSSISLDPKRGNYEIRNYHKLDKYLSELCDLVEKGQKSGKDFGMVAAGILPLKGEYMARLNRPGKDGRIHAEHAVIQDFVKKYGSIPEGSVCITTLSPCNTPMNERDGPSCADLLNEHGIQKVYCGYIDPTQHDGAEDSREYNLVETQNKELRSRCEEFADTFLDKVHENFANGKNPQDKGDSKRYHVPTKGSVSSLRKFAKGHSGRAAQLAHWMANMKSGHKK
jgi:pyrimidine deaminase RibD-like protein